MGLIERKKKHIFRVTEVIQFCIGPRHATESLIISLEQHFVFYSLHIEVLWSFIENFIIIKLVHITMQ